MDIVEHIKLAALSLPEGNTMRMVCPSCGGRGTMAVSRVRGSLRWKCHRARCTAAGVAGSRYEGETRQRAPEEVCVASTKLPEDVRAWLCSRYELEPETLVEEGVTYWAEKGRVLLPIRSQTGTRYGYVARAVVSDYTGPKAVNVIQDTLWDGGAFTRTSADSTSCIVVEDLFSAYAVAEFGYAGVALVGTHVTAGLEEALVRYDEIIVALDADATDKAAATVRKLQYLNVRQLPLYKDIKDMSVSERIQLLGNQ